MLVTYLKAFVMGTTTVVVVIAVDLRLKIRMLFLM